MLKITKIEQLSKDSIFIELDNGESATLYKFGDKDVYTVVSEHLNKSTLLKLKKDCILFDFCAKKIRKRYLYETDKTN